ncbi:cytochrome P450 [Podospora aff. communis PSN243]|uniref:Cytochrome P450 n=1 Tax=Podospora aff. communis PSN243 TaxID=3040156 RepID=A0AAV9GEZ4_9PEZI|nr:cytochrome P450 [Podospora aff. communis PSN243]
MFIPLSASSVAAIAVAIASAGILYFFKRLSEQRRFYQDNDLPKPPHDWLWGHAKLVGEYGKKITGDYMQAPWAQMKYDFKLPEVFYLDMWPFGPEFILCTGPDATAIPTTTNVFDQAEIVTQFFGQSVGTTFIEATNGPLWKELHQMMAPGLTPSATKTYHHAILDEAKRLHDRVHRYTESGEIADMTYELGRYPFAVIWHVLFGEQASTPELYEITKRLADISQAVPRTFNPITNYLEKRERAAIARRLEVEIGKIARARFAQMKTLKVLPTRTTATCLLDRMLLNHVQNNLPLDDRLMRLILENGKGMIAAGFGTTTDTSSYTLMLLSSFPRTLTALRAEHASVFPPSLPETLALLRANPSLLNHLPYTAAVIQETLRLFPIGMVVRKAPREMTSFELNGRTYPVKREHLFGVLCYAVHYDPEVFECPSDFRPERFLKEELDFPRNAYRPFERGLRSCMGQSLAMEEMKIMLVALARWFDFELTGHNPVAVPRLGHTDLDVKIGDHAWQKSRFSAGPNESAMMRVRLVGKK